MSSGDSIYYYDDYFRKLKGLKLSELPNVRDMGLMVLLLEETLPDCTIFGVDLDKLEPPSDDPDGQLSGRMKAISSGHNTDCDGSNLPPESVASGHSKS